MTDPDEDDVDALERQLRRSTRQRRALVYGLLVAGAIGPFAYIFWDCHKVTAANDAVRAEYNAQAAREEAFRNRPLTAAESAELDALAKHVVDDAIALRAAWQAATTPAALAGIALDAANCGIQMSAPTAQAADSFVQYGSIDANYFGRMAVTTYPAGAPLPTTGFDERVASARAIAARVAAGTHARADYDAARGLGGGEPILFVVADHEVSPTIHTDSFEPGELDGYAYAFDPGERAIVCAGHIHVINRPEIDVQYTALKGAAFDHSNRDQAALAILARDLKVQRDIAVATSLHRITVP